MIGVLFALQNAGNEELQRNVRSYLDENVRRGQKMTEGVLLSQGLNCTRKRVREMIKSVDPDGAVIRQTRRLKRRIYEVDGSHDLWHIDGNHKLIKFGFVVHACIDGFSRFLVYITCSDNNRANTVLKAFLKGAKDLRTLPRQCRSDMGGENVNVRRFLVDCFGADSGCFLMGRLTGNQKIERLFRDSTEEVLEPYIILFQSFVRKGLDVDNELQMFILHYLFKDRINASLLLFKESWNNH